MVASGPSTPLPETLVARAVRVAKQKASRCLQRCPQNVLHKRMFTFQVFWVGGVACRVPPAQKSTAQKVAGKVLCVVMPGAVLGFLRGIRLAGLFSGGVIFAAHSGASAH